MANNISNRLKKLEESAIDAEPHKREIVEENGVQMIHIYNDRMSTYMPLKDKNK